MMIPEPSAKIGIAAGHTDMRRGIRGLCVPVQTALAQILFSDHVFVFRSGRGDLINFLWSDGDDTLSNTQLLMSLEGMDWRAAGSTRCTGPGIRHSRLTRGVVALAPWWSEARRRGAIDRP